MPLMNHKINKVMFGGVTLTECFGRAWDISNLYCFLDPFVVLARMLIEVFDFFFLQFFCSKNA